MTAGPGSMAGVTFLQPTSWAEALETRAVHPEAVVIAGGTDVLVELNFDRLHPLSLLDLTRVSTLRDWGVDDGWVRVGAGVTYHDLIVGLSTDLPALATAARTVGSPPIRNRGTIGGNLATASPAGDCHPPLLASGAEVELASVRGTRSVPIGEFFVGPKQTVLAADELISGVRTPRATGPQAFSKVGVRNAMVISVCSLAVALHPGKGGVGIGIGSAGPVPLGAPEARAFIEGHLDETGTWSSRDAIPATVVDRFAELVASAAAPIDDQRGTSDYRRHALRVLAGRALRWCWDEYREATG